MMLHMPREKGGGMGWGSAWNEKKTLTLHIIWSKHGFYGKTGFAKSLKEYVFWGSPKYKNINKS